MSDRSRAVLGTWDIWALGVGIVVCGQYFGWNIGLKGNGPAAMLVASLIVCVLFLAWVLTLAELSVAMPRGGGPLEYGRRAGGPWLGFVMAWSLLLACLFGAVATALACGGYVAFLLHPPDPSPRVAACVGLLTVGVFAVLHARGVPEQAMVLMWMTCGAIAALAVFWAVAALGFSWDRAWPEDDPLLPGNKGWGAALDAIPYALWWLIIIEGVALAAEDTEGVREAIPRGLTLAMLTVIVMVGLTTVLACGAMPFAQIAAGPDGKQIDWPLPLVVGRVLGGRAPWLVSAFTAVALLGLLASYHGLLYATRKQAAALGDEGYLPPVPGAAVSGVVAAFVIANLWFEDAIKLAVLVAGLASLVWYVLAMACLLVLRRREPGLFARYRAPLGWLLPWAVLALSAVALAVYPRIDANVVPLTAALYAAGLAYFALWGRPRERGADEAAAAEGVRRRMGWLEWAAGAALVLALLAVGGVVLAAFGVAVPLAAGAVLGVLVAALGLLGAAALRHEG